MTFALATTTEGTRVELTHADLPDEQVNGHVDGWAHFLPRLRTVVRGDDPGPDHWSPDGQVGGER